MICLFVLTQLTNVTDRQTPHNDILGRACIASRGKNHPILMKFCTRQQILNWLNVTCMVCKSDPLSHIRIFGYFKSQIRISGYFIRILVNTAFTCCMHPQACACWLTSSCALYKKFNSPRNGSPMKKMTERDNIQQTRTSKH